MRGSAVCVNVGSVRHIMNGNHVASQLSERFHGSVISGALRTVHHDLNAGEIHFHGLNGMVDVFLPCVRAVLDFPHIGAHGKPDSAHVALYQLFNLVLQRIRKLITVSVKKLDSVKLHGIMGSGNHHAGIHLVFSGQISHGRRGNHSHIHGICPDGTNTRHQCIGKHISRYTRIASHHNRRFMLIFLCKYKSARLTKLHGQKRRQLIICNSSYAIRTK